MRTGKIISQDAIVISFATLVKRRPKIIIISFFFYRWITFAAFLFAERRTLRLLRNGNKGQSQSLVAFNIFCVTIAVVLCTVLLSFLLYILFLHATAGLIFFIHLAGQL